MKSPRPTCIQTGCGTVIARNSFSKLSLRPREKSTTTASFKVERVFSQVTPLPSNIHSGLYGYSAGRLFYIS